MGDRVGIKSMFQVFVQPFFRIDPPMDKIISMKIINNILSNINLSFIEFLPFYLRPTAGGLPRVLGGVGAASPKVRAKPRTACPDALTGSGAPSKDREAIIFPEGTWSCPEDAVLACALECETVFV